jgi:hypothetical protein
MSSATGAGGSTSDTITPRPPPMRINCTHVSMDRVHAFQVCDLCGRQPSMGWLYQCQQDRSQAKLSKPESPYEANPTLQELYNLGFSTSILRQASEGVYTDAQLEVLKSQRAKVEKILEEQKRVGVHTPEEQEDESLHPNITVRKRKNSKAKKIQTCHQYGTDPSRCVLKCCHASI